MSFEFPPAINSLDERLPLIIQGGMGINVSCWHLVNRVARLGEMGVVSGTAFDSLFIRILQDGDADGNMRRALQHFPDQDVVARILDKYFIEGGKDPDKPYQLGEMFRQVPSQALLELTVAANFANVFLAKEGTKGPVGINLLEKVQLPNLASLYGAMLAGVDAVLMGAGIPKYIPAILDRFALHEPASMLLNVEDALPDEKFYSHFNPRTVLTQPDAELKRPKFFAIIASDVLAKMLLRRPEGETNGFVIEGPTAGGHNAPPRKKGLFNERGEPIYGGLDEADLETIKDLGLPFWLAGSYLAKLDTALSYGASGVQVGTAFAFCNESGLTDDIKQEVIRGVLAGTIDIVTDPRASPTGFPFKVVQLKGTLSEETTYALRSRVCDLGYLRHLYRKENGKLDYRCPSEPVAAFLRKGGIEEETVGRKCLCNALMSCVGQGQVRKDGVEGALQTAGDEVLRLGAFLQGRTSYSAKDVIDFILAT
ncbi:MAG: nitronate monooxygenase [Candidatus Woesearchaeota archaeon]|nr:MAG: nitronate monooxygenase [Candidatus Woesearchaeota archaeon]